MSYIVADGARGFGGLSEEHLAKIKEYQREIKDSLDPHINRQVEEDIDEIHEPGRSGINEKR